MNPVSYFEIPVLDIDRAIGFYAAVFGYACERMQVPGKDMALLPHIDGARGISGALVRGERYVPGMKGPRIYLNVIDLPLTLFRAAQAGGEVVHPETEVGTFGTVAAIRDSEGNRIALYSALAVQAMDDADAVSSFLGGGGGRLRLRCDCC
jgi:predicted enzyme related to lactoylglutathione lyase